MEPRGMGITSDQAGRGNVKRPQTEAQSNGALWLILGAQNLSRYSEN